MNSGTALRRETRAAAARHPKPFPAILEHMPGWVAMINPQGTILQMNGSGRALAGAAPHQHIVGRSVYELIAPESRQAFERFLDAARAGSHQSLEFDLITFEGRKRRIECSAVPYEQAGEIMQLLFGRDISERKRMERDSQLLSAIVESSEDAIISKNLQGVITSWNNAAEQLFGYTAEEAIGRTIAELLIPEDRQSEEAEILARLRRGDRLEHFETVRRHKDGTLLEISLTISPVKDATGRVIGASKIARDITQRKRTEREAMLLAEIVQSSDDAIISKDLDGVITSWNRSAERLFGYTAEEAIGKTVAELLIPLDRQGEEPVILARLRRGERVDHFETVRKCKDGRLVDLSLTISPIRDAQGRVMGASKIARDIADRRRAERAIAGLNRQLMLDLAAMTRMQLLSTRLVQTQDFTELLEEIVGAGLEITGAQMGSIQLVEDGAWRRVAQQGLDDRFLALADMVFAQNSGWQSAVRGGRRAVVGDIAATADLPPPVCTALREAGVQAMQATPLVSRGGDILGLFATFHREPHASSERESRLLDILARQAADLIQRSRDRAALVASEGRFRQLANSMPQIVWTAAPTGQIDYYNDRWYQFTGLARDAGPMEGWAAVLHPEERSQVDEAWRRSMKSGEPFTMEMRLYDRQAGQWRWFISRAVPARNESGAIYKWFGSSTDIDEQKHVEAELRRANEDLEQFAFSASHDLQEPLRSVKIYSQLLASRYEERLDGQALEFLSFLRTGANRMELLVNDLLAYTRVTTLQDPQEVVDAEEVLAQVLENLAGAIGESGATVTAGPLPCLNMHASQLQQLLQNLISNAIKYRDPERAPQIHVSARLDQETWTFSVADNGIGIEPQYRKGIFGLFKRLHTEKEYSGSGIGLAICQRVVDRYGGRIWVESEPGKGSTFYFTLPESRRSM